MNVDFMHNQIIRDTVTDKFMESFSDNLLPYLISEYGNRLTDVQFYEDHLTAGLRIDGEFYYPLTVVVSGEPMVRTVKWQVSNYRSYDKFNPFTYKGKEPLEFELLDENPDFIDAAVSGKSIYSEPASALPVVVSSMSEDKTFLSGKYSQTFIDLMAEEITELISREFSISGLSSSGVILEVKFAPGTFMEHVVENATYRRLLIKARGCGARDLWIKWYRLDGAGTYTTADDVTPGEIKFELVDKVPAKIKEKEYRYLTAESADKYQSAMSRKNIVEWREMMRRVIKRGEVELVETEWIEQAVTPPAAIEDEVEHQPEPQAVSEPASLSYNELLGLIDKDEPEDAYETEEDGEDDDLTALLKSAIGLTASPAVRAEPMSFEDPDDGEPPFDLDEDDEYEFRAADSVEEFDTDDGQDGIIEEVSEQIEEETSPEDDTPVETDADRMRREIEAKIRAEMAEELRRKEAEAESLRRELEERARAEAREKELLAEAARAALLDRERVEREAEERFQREEAARREEEERRLEAERLEKERLEREAEEKRRLEEEEAARLKAEAEAAAEPVYVSKTVKLIFKRQIDPSITKRIHEIIVATIKYYHKEDVYIKIKANIPDINTMNLEFVKIPELEIPLLVNIIKVLGRSDLGITRAILD